MYYRFLHSHPLPYGPFNLTPKFQNAFLTAELACPMPRQFVILNAPFAHVLS